MTAEELTYTALSGSSALAAIVGTRIWPDAIPEDRVMPAVVFARAGTEPIVGLGGTVHGEFADMQIGCWAETRGQADAAAAAAISALTAAGHDYTGRVVGYDPDTGLFATTVEVRILAS